MKIREHIQRNALVSYFILAFLISWAGSFAAGGPKFLRGEELTLADAGLMFLPMLAGPSIAGIVMTAIVDGQPGLKKLFSRIRSWRQGGRWYAAAILIPPVFILVALGILVLFVSPDFSPVFVAIGLIVGVMAGFFEEIGWMGFAYPRMAQKNTALKAAIILGVLHALWHIVADYIGASGLRGAYWLPHFMAMMVASMTAMRVLIVWVYENTKSVLLSQIMHASSTGFLSVLVSTTISPAYSTLFYVVYAILLWGIVAALVKKYGKNLSTAGS
jgi:uncharacterized protein